MKEVKYIGRVNFQGDVGYIQIEALPEGLSPQKPENGAFILGHSETGHHHVVKERPGVSFFKDPADAVSSYLQVIGDDVKLEHMRATDTHGEHVLAPGLYKIINGVEFSPEGWRRMSD